MKKLADIRSDIRTLAVHIDQLREALLKRSDVGFAQVGKECVRTANVLTELLKTQQLPEHYKVAVVGRFKTGKSSFVNELLGARLASEDTNPETAAITTFRQGPQVKATVRFVSREEWSAIHRLYDEDPKHINAHRVKMWKSFGKPRKSKDGETEENFDLQSLEGQYLKPGGASIGIEMATDGAKKAETEFRRKLKEFTSGARPHHCMVQAIDIESPAAILEGGVLLIDTPGLDDTERFRVSLTEKTVEDVDAILFLTKSGESYGQSDKDFLLTLLRKGTVKQLIVVITQVDITYQQHLENAEANDEDPEPLSKRIEREKKRLAKELAATLAELSQDDSPAMRRYREQIGEVEIEFTSAKLHRDFKAAKPATCAIEPGDPGGVEKLKKQLLHMLSTDSRLAMVAQNIATGARMALLDLHVVLDTKLIAIRGIKDKEVAEQKLRSFRGEFTQASDRFDNSVKEQVILLQVRLQERQSQHAALMENITLLAERELATFEMDDVVRHWRSRRSGYWGQMMGLQSKVANRIFPKVQGMLGDYTESFAQFARSFEAYLNTLSQDGSRISESLELGATLPFDVTSKLKESLERSMARAQELIQAEELRVTSMLDDFVTEEVSERIGDARAKVTDIWGTGTTRHQSSEVQAFYGGLKQLLADALLDHLRGSSRSFGTFLLDEANRAPRDALEEVSVLLEQAADNIRAAAAAVLAGQKEGTESAVASVKSDTGKVLADADRVIEAGDAADSSNKIGDLPEPDASSVATRDPRPFELPIAMNGTIAVKSVASPPFCTPNTGDGKSASLAGEGDWADHVQRDATIVIHRQRMRDGTTGWSYEKVFPQKFLRGAVRVRLVDPYLYKPYQLRNLYEFLLVVAESARPKEIEVVTGFADIEQTDYQNRAVDDAAKDLFANYGVTLISRREQNLHDRYVIFDHGVLFKLGRGLDFYKSAEGLAKHRPANRRVRETEVDVFCRAGDDLAAASLSSQ